MLVHTLVTNPRFQWTQVWRYLGSSAVVHGLGLTLWLTAAVMVCGYVLGIGLAVPSLPMGRGPGFGFMATALFMQLVGLLSRAYGRSRNGCVNVTEASSTGGAILHECGAAARSLCRRAFAHTDRVSLLARPECRKAGLAPAGAG